jgi:hypothetical protein
MRTRFYQFMKKLLSASSCIFLIFVLCFHYSFAGDVPINRDFLPLQDGRWVWLKKIGLEKTRVILGRGTGTKRKVIWEKNYESGKDNETKSLRSWSYAYFVRLLPNKFEFDINGDGFSEVAISTFDFGNNMIRKVLIFSVRPKALVFLKEQGPFNIAADESIYQ